jgi:hypothetical protein
VSHTLTVKVPRSGPPKLVFPQRCVGCGAAKATESNVLIKKLVLDEATNEQDTVTLKYVIPHCERCARTTKAVFLAGLIPWALGFLAVGGAAFAFAFWGAFRGGFDSVGKPHNANSLVLGAAAGLFGGLVGGFLGEVVGRILLVPFLGFALLRAPLLSLSLLSDGDWVAGLRARPNRDMTRLALTFANDDVAREFQSANRPHLETA